MSLPVEGASGQCCNGILEREKRLLTGSSTEGASGQCCNGILERKKRLLTGSSIEGAQWTMLQWNSGERGGNKGCLLVLALRGQVDNVAMEFWRERKKGLLAGFSTEGANGQCCNGILEANPAAYRF